MNKNKKISTMDLAKTLSDFLFLGVENPEEKARKVFELKHSLTPHGFEKYIEYYFKKFKKYNINLNGKTNEFDGGIDLIGEKIENGEKYKTFIQCKKYSIHDISEDLITNFYGSIAYEAKNNYCKYEFYFITTSKFTYRAKIFGQERGIKLIDCNDIYKLQEYYTLENFKKDIFENEGYKEYEKCFIDCKKILDLYDNYFSIIEPTDNELYELLKQIRRDYSGKTQLKLWDVAKNETLKVLAKERPHNFEELKKVARNLELNERTKVIQYGEVFVERLRYFKVEKKESVDIVKKEDKVVKGFWNSLFKWH